MCREQKSAVPKHRIIGMYCQYHDMVLSERDLKKGEKKIKRLKTSTGHFEWCERDFHAVNPCLPYWLVFICALKVVLAMLILFIFAFVEDLQSHGQPSSWEAPNPLLLPCVPASSWFLSASLLPFSHALAPACVPKPNPLHKECDWYSAQVVCGWRHILGRVERWAE